MSCTVDAALTQTLHEVIRCPVCRATQPEVIVAAAAKSIQRCRRCSVCFLHPQPSPAEVASYFENGEEDAPAAALRRDYEDCRREVLAQVANEIQLRKDRGNILDVGCATGFFLQRFFSEWERHAVELSPRKADMAARNGIRVHVGDLFSASFQRSSFDVATMLDAFYYVRDPHSCLAELRRILKEDGILVLEIALATTYLWRRTGLVARLLKEDPLLEASDHLFDYTPRSLSLLLHNCGFILEEILTLPANRQERRFPDALCRIYSVLARAAGTLSGGRLCPGPRFMVIARKAPASPGFTISSSRPR
jgi:SAM-dependent methyltransferase